jgi:peptide/nickel transport system substrate-binding protein
MTVIALHRRTVLGGLGGLMLNPTRFASGQPLPKRIIGALEEDPPMINPALTTIISSFGAGCPVYGALTWINPQREIHPELAERWEASPDGKTYTFYLRKNVIWHDGEPFTSADVKWSFENVTAKLHPWGKGALHSLDTVDASDPHVAVVRLKIPSASLMSAMSNSISAILPKHLWEGSEITKNPHNKQPIGTGPFKLVEYIPGDRIRYVKNDKFYIPGQPEFDELVLRIIPDAAARLAAFEKGELDMLYNNAIPYSEIARVAKLPNVETVASDVSGAAIIGVINTKAAPYNDKRVRQAVAHAIDRKFISDNVLPGVSQVMVGPLPSSFPLHNDSLKDYAFDPAQANQMLDDAGYPRKADGNRFEFRLLWAAYDARSTKMADVIRQNLSTVGIAVSLQPLERGALNQRGFIGEQFDMIIDSYALGPDPDIGVERLYNTNNILTPPGVFTNNSAYSNPELDKLFDAQRVQTDFARRKEIYDKIQEIIWDAMVVLPIVAYSGVSAYRNTAMTNAFQAADGSKESFARVKLPVASADASTPAASAGKMPWILGAGAAAIGLGSFWLWRRSRVEDGDLDDTSV